SCSFSRTYSRMSQSSAPSRRIARISSVRASTWALVGLAFMLLHQRFNPGRMPVAQGGIVDEAELLAAAAVAAQVGAALDGQPVPGRERQGDHLGVGVAAGSPLLPGAELGERLVPQGAVVTAEADRCQQRQLADL